MGINIKKVTEEEVIEKYKNKIKLLNETIWDRKVSQQKIDDWLGNFKEEERVHVLYLLTQFIYFNQFLVETLLKTLYRDLYKNNQIKKIRRENDDTLDYEFINQEFESVLSKTRFIPLGSVSESSHYLMYPFRQVNNLQDDIHFSDENKIKTVIEEVDNFIFIDDLCGSGSQAITYSFDILQAIRHHHPNAVISYLMLVGTKRGKTNVINNSDFDYVDSVIELDDSYKCFSTNSRIFNNKEELIDINLIERVSGTYGKSIIKAITQSIQPDILEEELEKESEVNKHGFSDGQLLIAFNHNTPDNSLPITWCNEEYIAWNPIFKRHNKV